MKTDLRVIKTINLIKEVFLDLLKTKPLEKITVAEISRTAQINKGTFYLHYRDIYDLYDTLLRERLTEMTNHIDFYAELFEDPSAFANKCLMITDGKVPVFEDPVFHKRNAPYLSKIPELMSDSFREKIYEQGLIELGHENDLKIDYIFSSLFFFIKQELKKSEKSVAVKLLTSSIQSAFPNEVSSHQGGTDRS